MSPSPYRRNVFHETRIIAACIPKGCGKAVFSQGCLSVHRAVLSLVPGPFQEGYLSPRCFPWCLIPGPFCGYPWSQVLPQPRVPQSKMGGIPPVTGVPLRLGLGYPPPPRQYRRVSTCYAAGGTPLMVSYRDTDGVPNEKRIF